MTPDKILERIQATPAAMQIVAEWKAEADSSNASDNYPHRIAEAISPGLVRNESRLIGRGSVSIALGIPAGPLFLYALSQAAAAPPPNATPEQLALFATAWEAWAALNAGTFDVGDPSVRAGIDLFVGSLLDQAQADAIKALSPDIPDPVPELDVRLAILNDDGSLRL